MVLRTRQELRCEPSGRQGARQRREETTREEKREVVGIHCSRGHLPWQVDCYLPQRARGMDSVQERLTELLFQSLCSAKAGTST